MKKRGKETGMKALLVNDVQIDFCPGGALAVPDGDHIVPVINNLMDHFDLVLASRDWHPAESRHFEYWPRHCVRNTEGAEYHGDLNTARIDLELFKGTENADDGYSAFEATNMNLLQVLREHDVNALYVTGIATEYCIRSTVLESLKNNINTFVITDAVKGIAADPGDPEKALAEMARAGAVLITSKTIINHE